MWGSISDYRVIQKIGRGKYSEVFVGVHSKNLQRVCIKLLKPVRKFKILREIKILQILSGGPNIIDLLDVARDDSSQTPCLVFEFLANSSTSPNLVFSKFNDVDSRYYMF